MEIIYAILGSSVISVIITAILGFFQNRRKDTLSYITEERKEWREKIRENCIEIEAIKYEKKNKYLNNSLVKLEMNINVYGRLYKYDYKQDGHIWDTIDKIKTVQNKSDFEALKELLISYISLMLKYDWERSKNEVKGYSIQLLYCFIYFFMIVVSSVFYFVILKLDNWVVFFLLIFICFFNCLYTHFILLPDMLEQVKLQRKFIIDKMKIIKKNVIKYIVKYLTVIIISFLFLLLFSSTVISEEINNKLICYNINKEIYIYTNFNRNIVYNLKKEIEIETEAKVIFLNDGYNINEEDQISEEYFNIIKNIVDRKITNLLFNLFAMFILISSYILYFFMRSTDMEDSFIAAVKQLRYKIYNEFDRELAELCKVVEDVSNSDYDSDIIIRKYALAEDLLNNLKRELKRRRYSYENSLNTLESLEDANAIQNNIKKIDEGLVLIKKIKKSKIIDTKKMNMDKLSECICELKESNI